MTQRLDQAVEDGAITEEQADEMRAKIESGSFRPADPVRADPADPVGPATEDPARWTRWTRLVRIRRWRSSRRHLPPDRRVGRLDSGERIMK